MSQENVKIVREAFEAFLGGDREKTAQLVDPAVEFHGTVGGLQEGQIAQGQSQIDQTFEAEDLEAWEERRLEAEEFIDAGDDVVVLLHEYRRGRGSGVELETKTAVVAAVTGGRVVRIQGYMDRDAALKAAGLSEKAMSREERIAENEAFCRDLNERKAEWLSGGLQAAGFRCECWQIDCGVRIQLSGREWQEVRSRPERFAIAPGHTAIEVEPGVEAVVEEYPHFWIVEKRGKARDVAEKRA